MRKLFFPKIQEKIQLKDLLNDLERVEEVKDRAIQQINKNSKMSPLYPFQSFSLSASASDSISASPSLMPADE